MPNAWRWLVYLACSVGYQLLNPIGWPRPAAAAVGAACAGLLTAVVAPRLRVPRSTLLTPASLVMVPGALLARTVYWTGREDFVAAARNGCRPSGRSWPSEAGWRSPACSPTRTGPPCGPAILLCQTRRLGGS